MYNHFVIHQFQKYLNTDLNMNMIDKERLQLCQNLYPTMKMFVARNA